jgi:hypothetical protein
VFAGWLGIPNTTLSGMMQGNRKPSVETLVIMSQRLGPKIFEVFGMPQLMPYDPAVRSLVEKYILMSEEDQRKVQIFVESLESKDRKVITTVVNE